MSRVSILRAFFAAGVLCAVLVPQPGRADSCPDVFVLSGFAIPGVTQSIPAGVNLGAIGSDCTVPLSLPPTFIITPAANYAWIGINCAGRQTAPSGTVSVTAGTTTTTTLTFNDVFCIRQNIGGPTGIGNWYSTGVPLPLGTTKIVVNSSAGTVKYCALTSPNC